MTAWTDRVLAGPPRVTCSTGRESCLPREAAACCDRGARSQKQEITRSRRVVVGRKRRRPDTVDNGQLPLERERKGGGGGTDSGRAHWPSRFQRLCLAWRMAADPAGSTEAFLLNLLRREGLLPLQDSVL